MPDDRSEWISYSDVRDHIRLLNARHILLLNDACYSGGIFRNIYDFNDEVIHNKCSRKAITSGELEPVPDESIFIHCLLECLRNNTRMKIRAFELYSIICKEIKEIGDTKALYGVIKDSGDLGGDFLFSRIK